MSDTRVPLVLCAVVAFGCRPIAEVAPAPLAERATLTARVERSWRVPARRALRGLTLEVLEGSWGRRERLQLVFDPDSGQVVGEGAGGAVPGLAGLEPGDRCRLVYEGGRLVEAAAIRRRGARRA